MTSETIHELAVESGWMSAQDGWRGWFTVRRDEEMLVMGWTSRTSEHAFAAADAAKETGRDVAMALGSIDDEEARYETAAALQRRYSRIWP